MQRAELLGFIEDSLESTVRVSRGSDDMPLLFFVLRDSYSRIGGARFVIMHAMADSLLLILLLEW